MNIKSVVVTVLAVSAIFVLLACGEENEQPAAGTATALAIECHAAYRSSVTTAIEREETFMLSSAEPDAKIAFADLELSAVYFSGERSGESRSLRVAVTPAGSSSELAAQLYQLSKAVPPQNEFIGGHGFTGLAYAYHPVSLAELQYWCVAR